MSAAAAARPKVRVRMYRHGLGDCFLITFNLGGDEKHALIDCGTLGARYTNVGTAEVIDDIDTTTNGHLHLVVATHEHQDHLSGFTRLRDRFDPRQGKTIDHVWLAWTERPFDPDATKLARIRDALGLAVSAAARALRADDPNDPTGLAAEALLGFFGPVEMGTEPPGAPAGEAFAAAAKNSMEVVRGLVEQPAYREPGEGPIEQPGLQGFRFYVLGPPRDPRALHDLGAHGSSELYALTALARAATLHQQLATDDPATSADAALARGQDLPFDPRFRVERHDPRIQALLGETYLKPSEQWRAVDTDWLGLASSLAIQLDKLTNNTSLVLAIERIDDGKVLLFPGDAQEGNWLSWHDPQMKWQIEAPDGKVAAITAKDLLSRTVFYKVGHHSSHNATAKAKGLEMMGQDQNAELTAFIPVDRQVAVGRHPKGTWKMPARQLYRRLLEKCQGRVARSDVGWAAEVASGSEDPVESEFAGVGTEAEWASWAKAQAAAVAARRVMFHPRYVDYILE